MRRAALMALLPTIMLGACDSRATLPDQAADAATPSMDAGSDAGADASRELDAATSDGGSDAELGPGPGDAGDAGDASAQCVQQTLVARPQQVDMYIMLDRSASMLGPSGATTKWDAARSALTAFLSDPASDGLGVGLQYFPLGTPGVPESCLTDDECGASGGACMNRVCAPPALGNPTFIQCLSDLDCPVSSAGCVPFGLCSSDDMVVCLELGPDGCDTLGDCNPAPGECTEYAICEPEAYATPAVAIAPLPQNAVALTDSLTSVTPLGLTPTAPALRGALTHAEAFVASNPDHRVIAVLATDALPTDCADDDADVDEAIDEVATIAADGVSLSPGIETYVIGVFSPDETNAMQNLERIALAGGSERPFIVDPAEDVNAQFLAALDAIRGAVLDCEMALPMAPNGQALDVATIELDLASPGGNLTLEHLTNADDCDGFTLGWFYDTDPAPSRIRVCANTCDALHATADARIEIRAGCATAQP